MTKVGIYAIIRVSFTVFGFDAWMSEWGRPALFALGLTTIAFGAMGALATKRLVPLVAYLVLISSGTLIAAAMLGAAALGGALYYLVHTTLAVASLFLIVHAIADQRGPRADRFGHGPPLAQPALLGMLFLIGAIAAAGLPPLSGFIGKVLMLQGSGQAPHVAWFWAAVLGSGLLATFALARAGSNVFWKTHGAVTGSAMALGDRAGIAMLAVAGTFLIVFAGGTARYSMATAQQLAQPRLYVGAVLGHAPVAPPGRSAP
jgi:multicomponent K+:H+ antiporter subunit D